METNFVALFVSAFIPMLVGSVYYHKKVVGTLWMKTSGMTDEKIAQGNIILIFGLTYFLALLVAFTLSSMVIHQNGLASLFFGDYDNPLFKQVLEQKGDAFRTFGHGAIHGFIAALFFALPIIGTNALFEQRGWKYILVHWGYWAITLVLMGGLICAWR